MLLADGCLGKAATGIAGTRRADAAASTTVALVDDDGCDVVDADRSGVNEVCVASQSEDQIGSSEGQEGVVGRRDGRLAIGGNLSASRVERKRTSVRDGANRDNGRQDTTRWIGNDCRNTDVRQCFCGNGTEGRGR